MATLLQSNKSTSLLTQLLKQFVTRCQLSWNAQSKPYPSLQQWHSLSPNSEVLTLNQEQSKRLGQLLSMGIPLPIAYAIALDPEQAKAGAAAGTE